MNNGITMYTTPQKPTCLAIHTKHNTVALSRLSMSGGAGGSGAGMGYFHYNQSATIIIMGIAIHIREVTEL
jgi:hypothetical protein